MNKQLQSRNAIITGASQGFGKVVAQFFIEHGANVLLCARSADTLDQTRAELSPLAQDGQKILTQVCDVANPADVQALIHRGISEFGQVHILVNNAGVYGPLGAIETVNWDEWAQAIAINLYGTVLTSKEIIPHMRQHR
ncbi:MAG: SDR family NAD(P)-dependent oxidoreductase [Anaerolineae bacterium]|jgi:3-oxoacyl-[acyl-carrier protein] reductase|nr:SDR family NAD(P)-dependent oxidoreductase [Anaerolineae bacterium]